MIQIKFLNDRECESCGKRLTFANHDLEGEICTVCKRIAKEAAPWPVKAVFGWQYHVDQIWSNVHISERNTQMTMPNKQTSILTKSEFTLLWWLKLSGRIFIKSGCGKN